MSNNDVVSFHDNFGLILKGFDDKATSYIENCALSTTPMLLGASLRENSSEYAHKPYGPCRTFCR